MNEVFPILAGAIIAVGLQGLRSHRLRLVVFGTSCVVVGVVASAISGELSASWGYVVLDTAQVAFAIAMTTALLTQLHRRGVVHQFRRRRLPKVA